MPRPRSAYHHGDLRNALVAAATKLVREVGVDNFSLRDAARTVGVAVNATYRHFDSKSALLTAVASAEFEKLAAKMQKDLDDVDRAHGGDGVESRAIERFKATGRSYFTFAVDSPEVFRLMFGSSGMCKMTTDSPAFTCGPHQIYGDALDGLVEAGLMAPARRVDAEMRAWTAVHGLVMLVLEGAKSYPTVASRKLALEDILDFALRGVCAAPIVPSTRPASRRKQSAAN